MTSRTSKLPAGTMLAPARGIRCPELLRLHEPDRAQHLVQFYEDDSFVIETVAYLAARTLASGDSSVLLATRPHLEQIGARIGDYDLDLRAVLESGRYAAVDAAEALSQFMLDGRPDEARFEDSIGGIVRDAAARSVNGFVFAFGEMVSLLCGDKNADGAIRLEQLWNSLAQRHRFSLYCAYSMSSLGREPDADALMQICAEHALTIPTETPLKTF